MDESVLVAIDEYQSIPAGQVGYRVVATYCFAELVNL